MKLIFPQRLSKFSACFQSNLYEKRLKAKRTQATSALKCGQYSSPGNFEPVGSLRDYPLLIEG